MDWECTNKNSQIQLWVTRDPYSAWLSGLKLSSCKASVTVHSTTQFSHTVPVTPASGSPFEVCPSPDITPCVRQLSQPIQAC